MGMMDRYYSFSSLREMKRMMNKKNRTRFLEKNHNVRILVVLHLYYPDSWKEIREYLKNFAGYNWSLAITYPPANKGKIDIDDIRALNPKTVFYECENTGRDVGPFVSYISQANLQDYDVIFKLQSKGIHRKRIYIYDQLFIYRDWFINLFEGIVGVNTVHTTIDTICNDQEAGLVAADNLIVRDPAHKENLVKAALLKKYNMQAVNKYKFVAGTCFAIKPNELAWIKDLHLTLEDFKDNTNERGLGLGYIVERYFSIAVQQDGLKLKGNDVLKLRRMIKKPVEKIFYCFSSDRLHDLPYKFDDEWFFSNYDNKFIVFKKRKYKLRELRYVLKIGNSGVSMPLEQSYPYRYLKGDTEAYDQYCRYHDQSGMIKMSPDRFNRLIESIQKEGYNTDNIIITNKNILVDGQHRACCLAYLYGLDHEVEVLDITRLKPNYIIKAIMPQFMLNKFYEKKYNLEEFPVS